MNIIDEAMELVIPWDDLHSIAFCESDDTSLHAKWYNDNTRAAIERAVRRCAEKANAIYRDTPQGHLSSRTIGNEILRAAGLELQP